ncbi:chemotaxis response regulator protein-glutamate methylesterase [Amphritea sp. 1_MG-2023]|uniref:protein-glutamate methylesterase/protein-glutamine glutaminase n=1 Tax=Amphritea sp. 1_MG-2023 TaxID=3062670 RepID=UPI0026E301E6|nr:chemotaxis response regulator protein-glutamate methylesterase [Amphritea sp. 1_MG-2023]MDO6564663.1 chemotaxis response regulator protein-glutamate methylesterase [Amphritea sp. 1_MG-2023]
MTVRVLVVDDSFFFRNRIKQILSSHPCISVVGSANNGEEAVAKAKQLRPDVITMDVEMPKMDGITALKIIMAESPCQVVMLSSLTRRSASVTLEALALGAVDYMEKDAQAWVSGPSSADVGQIATLLTDKILALGRGRTRPVLTSTLRIRESAAHTPLNVVKNSRLKRADSHIRVPACDIVTVGASTGGPAALQFILTKIPANFPVPILLTQHMPKAFTSVFAKRLDDLSLIRIKEAENGDQLMPGHAYLAPGGQQMIIDPSNHRQLLIRESDQRMTYKPSVDLTFASVAKGYGKRALGIVMTGMGADGCDGARVLKKTGATIWAQDKESCTIFGMPKAVIQAELADAVINLETLKELFEHWGPR